MANEQQLALLREGVRNWNLWRIENPNTVVDLSGADLSEEDLRGADLRGANLAKTYLDWADLYKADLYKADLYEASLYKANLYEANLTGADLRGANLRGANLEWAHLIAADLIAADLIAANLRGANLTEALCIGTDLRGANVTNCRVFGVSAWDLKLDESTVQVDLCITPNGEPVITVDNLEVAQFIYLMVNNKKIRQIIDTIAKKAVLILGNFAPARKQVLNALRDELRKRDYLPIVFDFEKPSSRDVTETVATLAHMARFVIADLTDAKSVGDELANVVPHLPSVAVQPLIQEDDTPYANFAHWQRYPWVLDIYRYHSLESLLVDLKAQVIDPAERRANELMPPQKTTPPA